MSRETDEPAAAPHTGAGVLGLPWDLVLRLVVPGAVLQTISWFGAFTFVNLLIVEGMKCSDATWASLSLGMMVALTLGGLLSGVLVPWLGGRQTVLLSHAAACLAYGLFAGSRSLPVLGVGLAVCGAAAVVGLNTYTSLLLGAVHENQGRAIAVMQMVGGIASAAYMVVMGRWIRVAGYTGPFAASAVALAAAGIVFWWVTAPVADRLRGVREQSLFQMTRGDWRQTASGWVLFLLIVGSVGEPFAYHTYNQLTANLFHTAYGKGSDFIGTVTGVSRLFNIVGALTVGLLFEWLAPHRRWGLGMVLAGGCVAGMGLLGHPGGVVSLLMIYQVVYLLNWCGNGVSLVEAMGQERRTLALSLLTTTSSLGMVLAGGVHRILLGRAIPVPMVFALCGAVSVACGALMLARRRPRPAGGDSLPAGVR